LTKEQARLNVVAAMKLVKAYFDLKIRRFTSESYAAAIDAAARRFWKDGTPMRMQLRPTIRDGLRDAFILGADDIGIAEEDLIAPDWKDLDAIVTEEQSHLADLDKFMETLARDRTAKLSDADSRLNMWKNTFEDVRSQAKVILGKDEKLEWVYGDTEHCDSCMKLNGIVKRASFWRSHDLLPRNPPNPKIDCGGWNCQCRLEPTDKKITRGKLPSLP
jgi:hypothetical protein